MREAATVGAAAGIGKGELLASYVIVDSSPASSVSALWGKWAGGGLVQHTSCLDQSRPSSPSWGRRRQSRSYQRSEGQFP